MEGQAGRECPNPFEHVTAYSFRQEIKLGEYLIKQKEEGGLNPGAAGSPGPGHGNKNVVPIENRVLPPTLSEFGISKKLSVVQLLRLG
jgi:hypothetical protein